MSIFLEGYVDEQGHIIVEGKVSLPPGRVRVEIIPQPMTSTLEEIKTWFQNIQENGLPAGAWEESAQALKKLLDSAEETGLPADYADELDHYLYGSPKRGEPNESEES